MTRIAFVSQDAESVKEINVSDANPLPVRGMSSSPSTPSYVSPAALPAATDRSGTATTTSGGLSVAANANRRGLVGQNIGSNNIGFNEFGGTAAVGTAGTYTVPPGSSFSISTNRQVNFVAQGGNTAVTMTEY